MIQWGNNSALAGFQNALALGADIGGAIRQNRERSALADYMTAGSAGGIVATPEQQAESDRVRAAFPNAPQTASDPREGAFNRLMKVNPELAMQAQGVMQQREAAQAKAMQERQKAEQQSMPMVLNMLKSAKQNPQAWDSILSQAQQMGIPGVDRAPAQYDPAWVDQQIMTMEAFSSPEGQQALSTAGKVASDMGFKPGTPEHAQKTMEVWQASEAKPYVVGGETRLYRPSLSGAPAIAQSAPKVIPQKPQGVTDDEIWAQAHEAVRNGANADEVFRQLQAWGMKP